MEASARVEKIITNLIKHEGGYVNDPVDRGGPTKYGITQRTLSAYLERPASIEDVRSLDMELAREIYRQNYYFKPRINALPDRIEPVMLDMNVTHRPNICWRLLQRIVNQAGFGPISVDGIPGPQTFDATNKAESEMRGYLVNALVDARNSFFHAIVRNDPSQKRFIRGWIRRSETFRVRV